MSSIVIGILAALVITTFAGVQQRARNSERQTDVNAIAGQIEAYYASNGTYPSLANINDATWRADADNNFKLDPAALKDPSSTQTVLQAATDGTTYPTAATAGYNYWTDGTSAYTISAHYEGQVNGQDYYIKKSN